MLQHNVLLPTRISVMLKHNYNFAALRTPPIAPGFSDKAWLEKPRPISPLFIPGHGIGQAAARRSVPAGVTVEGRKPHLRSQ
jgi:hypothetical protein